MNTQKQKQLKMEKELTEQQIKEKLEREHPEIYEEEIKPKNIIKKNEYKGQDIIKKNVDNKRIMNLLKKDNPELYNKYKEKGLFNKEIEPESKRLGSIIMSVTLRRLGMYGSERLNINLYYLFDAVDTLIPIVGDAWLEAQYKKKGKDWNEIKKHLKVLRKKIHEMKSFYDHLEDQKFTMSKNIKATQKEILRYFRKTSQQISLLQPTLYELFVLLVENTNLKARKMPPEYFKILEHTGLRKIPLHKKPDLTPGISEIVIKKDETLH